MNKHFLGKLMKANPKLFGNVLNHPSKNEIQILYTQIDRDKDNVPRFRSYSYRVDPSWYFYPASTVKLPTAIFALEKINTLNIPGLSRQSTMVTDSAFKGQSKVLKDRTSASGLPSIEHYIKKILLVSDNDAYNRLYEFIGREETHQKLKQNGLTESRFLNRLAIGDGGEGAKHTNPVKFYNGNELVYTKPALYDPNEYPLELTNLIRGKGYMDAKDKIINEPYSFADKNVFTIADQQEIMKKLIFPEAYPKAQQFNLTADDYSLMYKYMSMYPTESDYPKYNPDNFWALYSKFNYYGREKASTPDPDIRIFNKYGDSYGYVIDNSYIVDFKNGVEFLLTAVVQSNEDGIYNDGKYEYETVCYPFLKNLGRVIYQHELKRKKKNLPDLQKFKFSY
ncbi:MAG TPA: serine hydrolase [Sphingobacteriaceae bacterium]|nr:serine hydrolase [Sphingobacteriaceae bacterium]